KAIGKVKRVVRLKRSKRVHADAEVVEVYRRHGFWKSRRSRWDDSEGSYSSHKAEIGKLCEAGLRLVCNRGRPEETRAELVYRGWAKCLRIANYKLLCPGRSDTFKTWHAGVQCIHDSRIIVVIIKRPVAGLLVDEVHALPGLV